MASSKPVLSQKVDNVELGALANSGPSPIALSQQKLESRSGRAPTPVVKRRSRKNEPQVDGIVAALCAWIVKHQLGISVNLLLLLTLTHLCFPRARQYTRKFYALSHYNPETGRYALGLDDMCTVSLWIIVFTGLRIMILDYIMTPVAASVGLVKKDKLRFAEQTWVFAYYATFWSVGMYLMYNSSYWFNFRELWTNWPDRELDGLFKWYYLAQMAFWVQSIFVLNIEEKRKDHWQMFTHHVITLSLMLASYFYHYTRVGNLILCLMDTVDLVFPVAKMLKYLGYRTACDCAFGLFMVSWLFTRHIIYARVIHSILTDYLRLVKSGCYIGNSSNLEGPFPVPSGWTWLLTPFRDPKGMICHNSVTTYGFVFLLLFLQVIMLVWFTMIVRVALRVLRGDGADDVRSDDEVDDEVEEEQLEDGFAMEERQFIEVPPLEEEVGVEGIHLSGKKGGSSRKPRKGHGASSGVSLPSDKKELLGRIGCDKGS